VIADRESDIYEEWYRIPDKKTFMITRACRNRKLTNGEWLFDYVKKLEVSGIYEIKVKARVGKRSAHKARLEIRFGEIEIKKPKNCNDKEAPARIKLRVVDVKEVPETVVGEEESIHWCLLTTHEIRTKEDALQMVQWYCQRWNIEPLFRTLKKQGLDVESSQLETAEGLTKLVVIALYVALQTMQLMLAREGKDQLVSIVFDECEQKVLRLAQKKLEGKTQKQKNPHSPEKLSWAAWIIARLGGWKGYQSESPPGPITMLRGLRRFESLLEGYQLLDETLEQKQSRNVCICEPTRGEGFLQRLF
jgi:Transposase DDE domain